jgi:hypothetical protein
VLDSHRIKRAEIVLQGIAVFLLVFFERESIRRDQVIEDRTATMIDELFPALNRCVSEVSEKASTINGNVIDLKGQVARMDERVGDVGRSVASVGTQVEDVDRSVKGFFGDRSGLIWGHSLNPYVLIGLLISVVVSMPLWGWLLIRRTRTEQPLMPEAPFEEGTLQSCSKRLDDLHDLLEKIHTAEQPSAKPGPELRKLVEQTERVIQETRAALAILSQSAALYPEQNDRNPEDLH